MGRIKAQTTKLPKRAYTKPSMVAIVFFIIILLVLVPFTLPLFTNKATVQALYLIALCPLAFPGLFCSYYAGLAIAKIVYKRLRKGFFVAFLIMVITQVICIAICVGIEIALIGYPMQFCFDVCQRVSITDAILSYLLFSTIGFLPAYYALFRYNSWYHNYYHLDVRL